MKVKTKLAIELIIALFAVIMLFTTKVNAETVGIGVSTSDKITAESFENIPSTINVNLKESEFEQTPSIILNIIIDKLKEQNIDLKDITGEEDYEEFLENEPDSYILVDVAPKENENNSNVIDINKYEISVALRNKEKYTEILNKAVSVVYNNSLNNNDADRKYVENLINKLPKNDKDEYDIFDFLNYKANLVR